MATIKIIGPLLTCLLLTACVSSPKSTTKLHQMELFSTVPVNAQSYRIRLQAPAHISQGTAEEMTLVKSAQITVKQGFSHFKVLNEPYQQTTKQTIVYQQPVYTPFYPPYYSRYYAHPMYSFLDDPFFNPPTTIVYTEPVDVTYHIELFKDNIPNDAFDARLILQHLGEKYGISTTGEMISNPIVIK